MTRGTQRDEDYGKAMCWIGEDERSRAIVIDDAGKATTCISQCCDAFVAGADYGRQTPRCTEVGRDGRTFNRIPASVWVCIETGDVHVFGDPRDVEPAEWKGSDDEHGDDPRAHNCDIAHCSSLEHRIATGRITRPERVVDVDKVREAWQRMLAACPRCRTHGPPTGTGGSGGTQHGYHDLDVCFAAYEDVEIVDGAIE